VKTLNAPDSANKKGIAAGDTEANEQLVSLLSFDVTYIP
jgi:hypothetical protein